MALIRAIILLFFLVNSSFAATYYFSNSGSDSNDCLSTGTACASISKMQSIQGTNDTLSLECGSRFRRSGVGIAYTTQANGVSHVRYGTCTGSNDPIITSAELLSGFSFHSTNIWRKSLNTDAGRNVSFDDSMAVWDETHNSGCPGSMTTDQEICYNGGFLYVRSATDPDTRFSIIERWSISNSNGAFTVKVQHKDISFDRIRVFHGTHNIRVTDVADLGDFSFTNGEVAYSGHHDNLNYMFFSFGGTNFNFRDIETANSITVTGNKIHDCGRGCLIFDRALPDGTVTWSNNEVYNFFNHGGLEFFKETGLGDIANGTVTAEGNTIYSGCVGISMGNTDTGGYTNLRFIDNIIYDMTASSDPRVNQGGNACGINGRGITHYGSAERVNLYMEGNSISDADIWGIDFKPTTSGGGQCLSLTMYNNTFYNNVKAGMQIRGNLCHAPIIKNNAFVSNGSDDTSTRTCCQLSCDSTSGCPSLDIQYNYFFPEDESTSIIAKWNNTGYTLATAKSSLGWAANNIGDNFGASPTLFVDAPNRDFTPASGSVLIDAGVNVGLAFNGIAPDIGAIESGEATSPPAPTIGGAVVNAITPSLLEITFATDSPPMLPASGCTGITLNGTSAAPSSCARNGSNNKVMDITLDQDVLSSDVITIDYSQAAGNITDNAVVEVAETSGFAVTNNVGGDLLSIDVCSSSNTFAAGRSLAGSFDDVTATDAGSSGCDCEPEFVVTCDLETNFNIGIARIYGDSVGTWWCTEYDLEYSTNGTDYTTWVTNTDCFGNQWWEQDLGGVSARYLRWTITGNTTNGRTQWRELEAYATSAPPAATTSGLKGSTITGVDYQ